MAVIPSPNALATIQIIGENTAVQALMTRMEVSLSPMGLSGFLMGGVDPWIRGRAKARFANEGDDVSGRWAPLLETTENIRADEGFGAANPINVRTGELEEYITGTPGGVGLHAMGATLTSPGTPASGNLAKKVQTAQVGKQWPPTVRRPVMGVNEADLAVILGELSRFIVTGTVR